MAEDTYLLFRRRILQHCKSAERTEGELRTLVLDSEDAQSVAIYLRARDDLARSGQITFGWPQKWRTAPQDSE